MKRTFGLYFFIIGSLLSSFLVACKKDTSNNVFPNTVTDYDGNTYHTLQIGTQTWMLENLIVTHDRHGNPIVNVMDSTQWPALTTPAYCIYNNDAIDNLQNYGQLYNWYAATDTALAPTGFHVATDSDWNVLTTYLGGAAIAGGAMKQPDTVFWANPNVGSFSSGFNAIPCGIRFNDTTSYATFEFINIAAFWWSSSQTAPSRPIFRYIFNDTTAIYRSDSLTTSSSFNGSGGMGIRCIKN
jgi:uncharacterized protein (TIGR02145 family)